MNKQKLERMEKINEALLSIGGVLMMLSYFPQMISIIRNQSSQGVSLSFLVMVSMALATFVFNGYILYIKHGDKKTLYSQLANLIPALITVVLVIVFR